MNPLDFLINSAKKIVDTGKSAVSSMFSFKPLESFKPEPKVMDFPRGEGLTGTQKMKALEPILPAFGGNTTSIKLPFFNKIITKQGAAGPETFINEAVRSVVEFPERVVQTVADIKNTAQGKDFSQKGVLSSGRVQTSLTESRELYNQAIASGMNEKQALIGSTLYGIGGVLLDLTSATDILTKGVLKATKFDPVLDRSLSRLNLNRNNFSMENLTRNAQNSMRNAMKSRNIQAMYDIVDDTSNILKTLQKGGVPNLSKPTQILQDLSKQVQGFGTYSPYNMMGGEVPLPGYRATPGQAPAFGLSTRKVEPVGFGKQAVQPTASGQAISQTIGKQQITPGVQAISSVIRGTAKVPENVLRTVSDELQSFDTSPVKTNLGLDFGNADDIYRIEQLQEIDKKRKLTNAEVLDAQNILGKYGVDFETPKTLSKIDTTKPISKQEITQPIKQVSPIVSLTNNITKDNVLQDSITKAKASGQSFDEWVKKIENESNISKQGKLETIQLNKIKGTDYPELDLALSKNKKLTLEQVEKFLPDNEMMSVKRDVVMPIEVRVNSDGSYSLMAGNHRVAQQLINGDKTIYANIVNEGGSTRSQLKAEWDKIQDKGVIQKAKDYWKSIPKKQGGFAKIPFMGGKGLTEADRLIAQGKIRVVSRNNRDVYQYKKGGEWVNARDEDSAIKQVTPQEKAPKKTVEYPSEIENARMALEIRKEALENSRFANADLRFMTDKEGRIRELGDTKGKLSNKIEDMMREAGVEDAREYTEGIENYKKQQADIKLAEQAIKEQEKVFKEKLAREKMIAKESPLKTIAEQPKPEPLKIDTTEGEGRSIEIQAQQALEVLKSDNVPVDISFPTIIEKTVTNVKQKVNHLDTFLRTPKYVMEKIGFGKEAQALRDAMDEYWKELPKNIEKITEWSKRVSKDSNQDIFRYLDGEAITLLPQDKVVAQEIQAWLADWAKRLKLPQDKKVSHYITHIFDQELMAKEFDEDLAKIIADKIPGQVYDPFLEKRLGAKGYKQDTWQALSAYVKRGTRKVHMDPVLETIKEKTGGSLDMSNIEKSQFEYIQKYIDNINLRPSKTDEGFDNLIKSVIGYKFGQRPVTSILKTFRQATFRGMLGLNPASALRNLSQGANTFAELGTKYTTLGYLDLFKKGAGAELEREGVLNAGFIQDKALSATKKMVENVDKVLFTMFDTAEKINRGSAYFGAKREGLSRGMSETEAIKYAKDIVRKTQFAFDVIDTPVGMSSDIMKTMFQFQTFTTKQIEFLGGMAKRAVSGDQKAKNVMGLLRYSLAGLLFVYTIGKAFGMDPEELLPWYRFQVPPSLKFPVELSKALLGTPDKYGNARTLSEKASDVGKSAIGLFPAGSQIKKTYEGTKMIMEGGSYDKAGRMQFEAPEGWAAKLQAVLFGKYPNANAEKYFNRVEDNAKDQAKVKPVYDQAQKLKTEGREEEAKELVNSLSETDYAIYKKIKTAEKTKTTLEGKKKILPIYNEAQKLKADGKVEEAKTLVVSLSDEEYEHYQAVKKDREELKKASEGEKPEFGEVQTEENIIKTVWTYAKALGVDPVTAFNRIRTGQRIRYVTNGVIVVERMPMSESQRIKEEQGGKNPDMKLDHTIPLQLGGSNDQDNLKLIPTDEWATYTPVENAIGLAVRNGKISKTEAQTLIKDFKDGKITSEDVFNRLK